MRLQIRILILILLAAPAALAQDTQDTSAGTLHVRHVLGMQGVKHGAVGLLLIKSDALHFDAGRSRGTVPITSIEDIYIGTETTQAGGKLGEVAKGAAMAAPYDSGAALTLLMIQKVDVLTICYRDTDNGLHAAIFAVPKNRAELFKADLIRKGAHVNDGAGSTHVRRNAVSPGPAAATKSKSTPSSAIIIAPVNTGDVAIPAEFRLAIYEDLVQRIQSSGLYARVYRSGDHRSDNISGLVTLVTEVEKFTEGNQTERELITVLGATKVTLNAKLTTRDGTILMDEKVEGKVRFFGENLDVIHVAAKQITNLLGKRH